MQSAPAAGLSYWRAQTGSHSVGLCHIFRDSWTPPAPRAASERTKFAACVAIALRNST
jgi:hypothetical protein